MDVLYSGVAINTPSDLARTCRRSATATGAGPLSASSLNGGTASRPSQMVSTMLRGSCEAAARSSDRAHEAARALSDCGDLDVCGRTGEWRLSRSFANRYRHVCTPSKCVADLFRPPLDEAGLVAVTTGQPAALCHRRGSCLVSRSEKAVPDPGEEVEMASKADTMTTWTSRPGHVFSRTASATGSFGSRTMSSASRCARPQIVGRRISVRVGFHTSSAGTRSRRPARKRRTSWMRHERHAVQPTTRGRPPERTVVTDERASRSTKKQPSAAHVLDRLPDDRERGRGRGPRPRGVLPDGARPAERGVVESPKAYLATTTTRLAINHLRSARARRESYVGTWLPEPVVADLHESPEQMAELSDSLSMAFLVLLESLSPVERAVFLLREVFDYSYEDIAQIVDKSEANCRQIFVRARQHIGGPPSPLRGIDRAKRGLGPVVPRRRPRRRPRTNSSTSWRQTPPSTATGAARRPVRRDPSSDETRSPPSSSTCSNGQSDWG